MIVFTHIPKTGGTTLRLYLTRTFGARLLEDYAPLGSPKLPVVQGVLARLGLARGDVPWSTACIIGHKPSTYYERRYPHARHVVFVRDPVERVVSHYHHYRRVPEKILEANGLPGHLTAMSLDEFAALPCFRDLTARLLDGKSLATFACVGITEQFEAGVRLFTRIMGLPAPEALPRRNRNQERAAEQRYDLDPSVRQRILDLNQADQEVYQNALRRFEELCQANGLASLKAAG